MTDEVREGGSGSPMIGARGPMGEPGITAMSLRVDGWEGVADGLLYMTVANSTMEEPRTNATVMGYEKRATEARNEMMMDRDVAKPFLRVRQRGILHSTVLSVSTWRHVKGPTHMMLSLYRITTAVMSPPSV
jgi:hypothetical protein